MGNEWGMLLSQNWIHLQLILCVNQHNNSFIHVLTIGSISDLYHAHWETEPGTSECDCP